MRSDFIEQNKPVDLKKKQKQKNQPSNQEEKALEILIWTIINVDYILLIWTTAS